MPTEIEIMTGRVYLVYDTTKTALLNKLYYGYQLARFRRYNFWMEIVIAIGAASSGIAGLALWKTESGQYVWGAFSALSVVLATIKPSLKFAEKVENYAKLYGQYTDAYIKMSVHLQDIQLEQTVTNERIKAFGDLRVQAAELESLGDPVRDNVLIEKLTAEVNRTIPIEDLWVPR